MVTRVPVTARQMAALLDAKRRADDAARLYHTLVRFAVAGGADGAGTVTGLDTDTNELVCEGPADG